MTDDNPTAGWYTDPLDENAERYWDGEGWTQETRTSETLPAPAPPQPPAEPNTSAAETLVSPATDGETSSASRSLSQTQKLAIGAVATVLLIIIAVMALGGSDSNGVRLYVEDRPDRSGAVHIVSPGDEISGDNELISETGWVSSPRLSDLRTGAAVDVGTTFLEHSEEGSSTSEFGYVDKGEFVEVLRLREESVDVGLTSDKDTFVVTTWSYSDSGASCFVGSLDDLTEIRTRGGCSSSDDGSTFLATEWTDGSVQYEVLDRDDKTILDGTSGDYPVLSTNGRYLATVSDGGREELEMWDLATGEQLAPDTRADDITISGMIGSRAVVSAWDESAGRADILLVDTDGTETKLTRSESRYSRVLSKAGIIGISSDNETTIFSVSSGDELGSIRADWVQFTSAGDGRWMAFGMSDGRVDAYWANGATMPTEVGSHRVTNGQPAWAYFGSGNAGAYAVHGWTDNGTEGVLARVNGTSEASILEEDLSLSPSWISPDASQILAVNYDNGAELTLIRPGERPEVLDDEDSIYSVFVRDGAAYYTVLHNDESEIRTVRLSADARPETLFEDASLITIENPERHGTMLWLQGE